MKDQNIGNVYNYKNARLLEKEEEQKDENGYFAKHSDRRTQGEQGAYYWQQCSWVCAKIVVTASKPAPCFINITEACSFQVGQKH